MSSTKNDKINKYVLTIIQTKHGSLTGKDLFQWLWITSIILKIIFKTMYV